MYAFHQGIDTIKKLKVKKTETKDVIFQIEHSDKCMK